MHTHSSVIKILCTERPGCEGIRVWKYLLMSCRCRPGSDGDTDGPLTKEEQSRTTTTVATTTKIDSMIVCSRCGTVVEDGTAIDLVEPSSYESYKHSKFIPHNPNSSGGGDGCDDVNGQNIAAGIYSEKYKDGRQRGTYYLKTFLANLSNSLSITSATIIDRATFILLEAYNNRLCGLGAKGRQCAAAALILSAREAGLPLSVERCSLHLPDQHMKDMSIYKMMRLIIDNTNIPLETLAPLDIESFFPMLLEKRIIPFLEGQRIFYNREQIRKYSEYLLKLVRKSCYEIGRKQEPLALAILSLSAEASSHITKAKKKMFLKQLLKNSTTSLIERRKEILMLLTKEGKAMYPFLPPSSREWISPAQIIVLLDDLVHLTTRQENNQQQKQEQEEHKPDPPSYMQSIVQREKRKEQIETLSSLQKERQPENFEEIIIERLLVNGVSKELIISCSTIGQLIALEEEELPFLSMISGGGSDYDYDDDVKEGDGY